MCPLLTCSRVVQSSLFFQFFSYWSINYESYVKLYFIHYFLQLCISLLNTYFGYAISFFWLLHIQTSCGLCLIHAYYKLQIGCILLSNKIIFLSLTVIFSQFLFIIITDRFVLFSIRVSGQHKWWLFNTKHTSG